MDEEKHKPKVPLITLRCKKRIDRYKEIIEEINKSDLENETKDALISLCEEEIVRNYKKGV